MRTPRFVLPALLLPLLAASAPADVGDPQVRTDDPWYPGELACSTFERLFATQAAAYRRATGRPVTTDEDKVLASWLWRNTHYWHGEEGGEDLWGRGFGPGKDTRSREYWTGLFANGFALCGTTHSQWVAEMEALLGHGRGRTVGAAGHNTFEVFLTGGPYGAGRWVLLDHDLSTVVFAPDGSRLLGMAEVVKDWRRLTDRNFRPERQRGWLICGLHPDDAASYRQYTTAEYLSGYAGPPPTVHLRRGESLRRYLRPGLGDGKTFVFWGRNSNAAGVPGPERPQTWANQPGKMYGAKASTPYHAGQARYANAVYTYRPDFRSGDYREGVFSEDDKQVTFAFATPYIIAATPPNAKPWGIFDAGCENGLVLSGKADCHVSVSVDRGATWADCGRFADGLDMTDRVKGHRQYLLRLGAQAAKLADSKLTIRTVCQANAAVMPHLTDGGSKVRFEASGRATVSAGPNVPQAARHVVAGKIDGPAVTLELKTPHGEPVRAVHAAARVASGSPPRPDVRYQIDYSTDGGKSWRPVVKDWTVNRRGDEPRDFWSQSFCWGSAEVKEQNVSTVRVRFRNDGGKRYLRPEVHLVYDTRPDDPTRVTFAWTDGDGQHQHSHTAPAGQPAEWTVPTGTKTETRWVEFAPAPAGK